MAMGQMSGFDMRGKRILIRVDMNVPMRSGEIQNERRIRLHLPTIKWVLSHGGQVRLVSHLGRPQPGKYDSNLSLAPIAKRLGEILEETVLLSETLTDDVQGRLVMYENIRFQKGETSNDKDLAQHLAGLCDVFIMDAFGMAHRTHASTCGVARYARNAAMGLLFDREVSVLTQLMKNPRRPLLVIVGGAKTETKVGMLEALSAIADELIPGGAIANTLLVASGVCVGGSLYDADRVDYAKQLLKKVRVLCPEDFVCANAISDEKIVAVREAGEVKDNELIVDVGPKARAQVRESVLRARTILWNGPLGVFETPAFAEGTRALAEAVAVANADTVVGGGDTIAAIEKFGVDKQISHISSGGGAFLEFIRTGDLPIISVMRERLVA